MEDRIGREVVKLEAVEMEEPSKEGVNGKSQTLKKMRYENYSLTNAKLGILTK